jgi:hypothetical protein
VLTLFDVEAVLDHVGDPPPSGKKSEMEFLVKFLEYDEEYNLWLPWAELRTIALSTITCATTECVV